MNEIYGTDPHKHVHKHECKYIVNRTFKEYQDEYTKSYGEPADDKCHYVFIWDNEIFLSPITHQTELIATELSDDKYTRYFPNETLAKYASELYYPSNPPHILKAFNHHFLDARER